MRLFAFTLFASVGVWVLSIVFGCVAATVFTKLASIIVSNADHFFVTFLARYVSTHTKHLRWQIFNPTTPKLYTQRGKKNLSQEHRHINACDDGILLQTRRRSRRRLHQPRRFSPSSEAQKSDCRSSVLETLCCIRCNCGSVSVGVNRGRNPGLGVAHVANCRCGGCCTAELTGTCSGNKSHRAAQCQ